MAEVRVVLDVLFKGLILLLAVLALIPVLHLTLAAIVKGGAVVVSAGLKFFTETPPPPGDRTYGVLTSLIGTIELAVLSALIGVPIPFMAAILVVEFPHSRLGRIVRLLSRTLLELPTILIGMFVFAIIVIPLGSPSILAASIALALVMLPYVTTYLESALSSVPRTYREAGLALGMTKARVAFAVVVPIAVRGVVTGVLVGLAKAMGETAPLLFTLGRARTSLNVNPLGPGDAIPLLIYDYAQAPYENLREVAWGATLVLISLFLLIYVLARLAFRGVRV